MAGAAFPVDRSGGDNGGTPVALVFDLADGSWSRLPVDANLAGFVSPTARTDR